MKNKLEKTRKVRPGLIALAGSSLLLSIYLPKTCEYIARKYETLIKPKTSLTEFQKSYVQNIRENSEYQ